MLNDVIHFKIHIQKKLEDYEAFVDDEVSHELEAMDDNDNGLDQVNDALHGSEHGYGHRDDDGYGGEGKGDVGAGALDAMD